jgi:GT2 family glycosyltransferase/glycosyltransferase involved in cell wall biosynthesis
MAGVGHEVCLVSAELASPWRDRLADAKSLSWACVLPERANHVYFTGSQAYADRLYDTVLALHAEAPLDVIDVPDAGGEALTLLRAKRLLAQFPRTCVAVCLQPSLTVRHGVPAHQPVNFAAELTAYAELYTRRHASIVLSAGVADEQAAAVAGSRLRQYRPGLPDLEAGLPGTAHDAALTVLWLGPVCPGAGLGTLLRAFELAHEQEPCLHLVLRGADTPTDPIGRSYWQHLRERMTEPLRRSVSFEGPVRAGALDTLPAAGSQCLLASGARGTSLEALLAMAAGYVVLAPAGSIGADLIRDRETGWLIPDRDPVALAGALLTGLRQSGTGVRLGSAAAEAVRTRFSPRQVGDRLSAVYTSAPTSGSGGCPAHSGESVSVVIPLYNQGKFLPAALDSIRRSGIADLDIVVVDDGSTDPGTSAVLAATAGITSIRQPHRGLSAARNAGIHSARGALVLVLDADDMIHPGFLPAAVDALRRRDDLAFASGYVRYFGLLDLVYVPAGPAGNLNLVLHTHLKSAVLYRREALERVGGYDENLPAFEDWEIQIRLTRAGYDSDVLPLVGQLYRRHADSMSFSMSNGMRSELIQYLVRKHAHSLTKVELITLLQTLVDLWKTGYEPSTSVLLQRAWWPVSEADAACRASIIGEENRSADRQAEVQGRRAAGQRQGPGETRSASPGRPLPSWRER